MSSAVAATFGALGALALIVNGAYSVNRSGLAQRGPCSVFVDSLSETAELESCEWVQVTGAVAVTGRRGQKCDKSPGKTRFEAPTANTICDSFAPVLSPAQADRCLANMEECRSPLVAWLRYGEWGARMKDPPATVPLEPGYVWSSGEPIAHMARVALGEAGLHMEPVPVLELGWSPPVREDGLIRVGLGTGALLIIAAWVWMKWRQTVGSTHQG